MNKLQQFSALVFKKLTDKESVWLAQKSAIVSTKETQQKFPVFFSMSSRFISDEIPNWNIDEQKQLEIIYPGFGKTEWSKRDLVRAVLMMSLAAEDNSIVLNSFFEIADMQELVAIFKGLYLLENAQDFTKMVEEGIRTNMVNVFDALVVGNPFPQTYLEEWAWNQLVLKAFFLDRPIYTMQFVDEGKNENLANMLQDYVRERWAADRTISPEIWRLIDGYLRDDVNQLIEGRTFEGIEKEAIDGLLNKIEISNSIIFWDNIGKNRLK